MVSAKHFNNIYDLKFKAIALRFSFKCVVLIRIDANIVYSDSVRSGDGK